MSFSITNKREIEIGQKDLRNIDTTLFIHHKKVNQLCLMRDMMASKNLKE